MFSIKEKLATVSSSHPDFAYLQPDSCYVDSACQTLRPQVVIDAETEYYTQYNACGGRVKYRWGELVDGKVREARSAILAFAGKSEKDYCVAFTLNTTYGINLVLHQIAEGAFNGIVTSEIEHNSVLLPSMTWAKKRQAKLTVLPRAEDGSLQYEPTQLQRNIVLMNTLSNIDGRSLPNAAELAKDVHAAGGIFLIDAAQSFAHAPELLRTTDFDAAFGSGHKMFGPSLGFIIIKRSLLPQLNPFFIGGGTVTDVTENDFTLLREGEEAHAFLEPGLQSWSGILGLSTAVHWLEKQQAYRTQEEELAQTLFESLQEFPRVHLFNKHPSSIISFHVDGIDAHQLALYFSERNVMCRSGYFCCHRYLLHQLQVPPLLRVSLGLYNTPEHIQLFLSTLRTILTTL